MHPPSRDHINLDKDQKIAELQKALAVEAALESVRSITLSMPHSDRLLDAVHVILIELQKLDLVADGAWISVIDYGKMESEMWISVDGKVHPKPLIMQLKGNPALEATIESWKRGDKDNYYKFKGQEVRDWWEGCSFLLGDPSLLQRDLPEVMENYEVWTKHGGVSIFSDNAVITDETKQILARFAKVFELTYTRFLDLQKAEKQARDAEVETALEKVRSSSLAIQHSDELSRVVSQLFLQLKKLDFNFHTAWISISRLEDKMADVWLTGFSHDHPVPRQVSLPFHIDPLIEEKVQLWERGEKYILTKLEGKDLERWLDKMSFLAEVEDIEEFKSPDFIQELEVCHRYGVLGMNTSDRYLRDEHIHVLSRFSAVFEQAYTRFLDLQKAEAQTRIAQIEVAIERVRSRMMAMQLSTELSQVVHLTFNQMAELGFDIHHISISIVKMDDSAFEWWNMGFGDGEEPFNCTIPFFDHPFLTAIAEAKLSGLSSFTYLLEGVNKNAYDDFLFTQTELRKLPKELVDNIRQTERIFLTDVFTKYGSLEVSSLETLTDEYVHILERFAHVFEQTYTRFLDIQKAEAQTREAQIEASLERVRARTMAMHKSDELADSAAVLFKQLVNLGINTQTVGFILFDPLKKTGTVWLTPDGQIVKQAFTFPAMDDPTFAKIYQAWEESQPFYIADLKGKELDRHLAFVEKFTPVFGLLERTDTPMPSRLVINAVYHKYGFLGFNTKDPLNAELDLLKRFAKTFEQTYTRFLDLQKAEAQARESQIEAALERVRAASMAMQSSDDLFKTAGELFKQLELLGVNLFSCGFALCSVEDAVSEQWMYSSQVDVFNSHYIDHAGEPFLHEIYKAWESQKPLYIGWVKEKDMDEMVEFLMKEPTIKANIDLMRSAGLEFPRAQKLHAATFAQGYLLIITLEDYSETDIFIRFAKVFEQTFTRYLDLKKAEAQAREAQIEAAMERIRSRAIAMRTSDELKEVIIEMRRQIDSLGQLDLEASVIHLYPPGEKMFESFAAVRPPGESGTIVVANILFPVDAMGLIEHMIDRYHSDQVEYTIVFDKENAEKWQQVMVEYAPMIAERREGFVANRRTSDNPEYWNFADFSHGSLLLVTHSLASEDTKEVLRKASQVFDQAYTRFLDLQKAEAQARKAQVEAALERVRAASLAMHKSEELSEVATVLFEQLQELGIESHGCGLILMNDGPIGDMYYSIKGSLVPEMLPLPVHDDPELNEMYTAWKEGDKYKVMHIHGEAMDRHHQKIEAIFKQYGTSHFQDIRLEYLQKGIKLTELFAHHAYFSHGALLLMNDQEVEGKMVFIRFAKAFEQAYTRFLDLQRVEAQAREAQIEAALERVRAASMAMHTSEEITDVILVVVNQLRELGIPDMGTGIHLGDQETREYITYAINQNANGENVVFITPKINIDQSKIATEFYQIIESGKTKFTISVSGETLHKYYDYMEMVAGQPELVAEWKKMKVEQLYFPAIAFYKFCTISTMDTQPLTEEQFDVFERIANVFGMSYRRFLDLQKAEAQAREAQIEVALERIRARTLAMHNSEELPETGQLMFEQFKTLGLEPWAFAFCVFRDGSPIADNWAATKVGALQPFLLPHNEDPVLRAKYHSWKAKKQLHIEEVTGKKLTAHMKYMQRFLTVKESVKKTIADGIVLPKSVVFNCVNFQHGYVMFATEEQMPEQHNLFIRFTSVFEQTYTRFLDLKKVEAQAREAQIEAALERVRAASMAMHTTEELNSVVSVLFNQLKELKLPLEQAYINIVYLEEGYLDTWLSPIGEFLKPFHVQIPLELFAETTVKEWREGKEMSFLSINNQEEVEAFVKGMDAATQTNYFSKRIKELNLKQIELIEANNRFGKLGITKDSKSTLEEERLVVRLSKVFEQTYTRFLDLQKAEKQTQKIQLINQENERLLHSILPEQIAEQIRQGTKTIVRRFDNVSILFADIVGFTVLSEKISPPEVVDILNGLFSRFDDLTDKYGLEKIKTIGDAYMVAGGVPEEKEDHAHLMFDFAKDMLRSLQEYNQEKGTDLKIRIGISSGPVVAGVIGKKKFAYDLWGDSVNTAARMEAYGRQDCIQISPATYELIKNVAAFEKMPNVEIKGKGKMDVYVWEPIN